MSEENGVKAFSDKLEKWLKSDQPKTLSNLSEVFAEKGFAILILVLMTPSALPFPTGGVAAIFEIIVILLSLEMVAGLNHIWLPRRWRNQKLNPVMLNNALPKLIKFIRWFERRSKPRNKGLLRSHLASRIYGLTFLILALFAVFSPPFSGLETLPGLGVVLITLAIILEDSLFLLAGYIIGTLGVVVYIGLGKLLLNFLRDTF